jgi:hypothetical protein
VSTSSWEIGQGARHYEAALLWHCPFKVPDQLNPHHRRADGDAVAAGFKKEIPFS